MTAIDETIKQLEAARDRAIDLIAGLREFQSGLGSVPALAAPTATPPTAPKLVNITRSQPKRRYLNVRAKKTETPAAPVKESAAKSPRKPSLEKTPAAPTPPPALVQKLRQAGDFGAGDEATHPLHAEIHRQRVARKTSGRCAHESVARCGFRRAVPSQSDVLGQAGSSGHQRGRIAAQIELHDRQ